MRPKRGHFYSASDLVELRHKLLLILDFVEETFSSRLTYAVLPLPVSSFKNTKSEKVPPVSTVTRYLAIVFWL